jgi:hypothetical protein
MLCRPGRTGRPAGDVVRGIDTLGNARFVRTVLERAQEHRSAWLVSEFGRDRSERRVGRRGDRHRGPGGAHRGRPGRGTGGRAAPQVTSSRAGDSSRKPRLIGRNASESD